MAIQQFPLPAAAGIPSGDTAGRPAAPVVGDTYYNGETGGLEIYSGSAWVPSSREWGEDNYPPQAPLIGVATSSTSEDGEITVTWTLREDGGSPLTSIFVTPFLNGTTAQTSQIAATTSSTSLTLTGLDLLENYTFKVTAVNANGDSIPSSMSNSTLSPEFFAVDFLVVGGGGGGGEGRSDALAGPGGGGAGGYRTSAGTSGGGNSAEVQLNLPVGESFTVTVGAGGAAETSGSSSLIFATTADGGGRGGNQSNNNTLRAGAPGGSGGGGSGRIANFGSNGAGGAATAGQGSAGGSGSAVSGNAGRGGGGGGAANAGATGNGGGGGGNGLDSSITGNSVTRGGGGGGGGSAGGTGGNGGGGNGAAVPNAGTANTGGGGGGVVIGNLSAAGGSGIAVLTYADTLTATIGGGLTSTTNTDTSNSIKITTFNAGTGLVSIS